MKSMYCTSQVKDILECRIEAVLEDIELTRLCDLPEDEAVFVDEFVNVTERTCQAAAESLSRCVDLGFPLDWNDHSNLKSHHR